MSVPRFSIEEVTPHGYKYGLAMRLLEEIAPRLLSINNPLTTRVASAYSWFLYLKEASPSICRQVCGEDFNQNYKEWGEEELEKIAEALSKYATLLLKEVIKTSIGAGKTIKPPRPP